MGRTISGHFLGLSTKIDGVKEALDRKIDETRYQLDVKIEAVKGSVKVEMDQHEQRDLDRHEDTIQRLTRVETIVEANGHGRRRKAI